MTVTDITSEHLKTVLITGPNRGFGYEASLEFSRRRCRLVLLGRDQAQLHSTAADCLRVGACAVTTISFDAASRMSVHESATAVVEKVRAAELPPVDVVVGNAGIQRSNRNERSADGDELTFAVNVIANHHLITALAPALADAAHIVLIGSGTHYGTFPTTALVAGPAWSDPLNLASCGVELPPGRSAASIKAGQCAYSTSKLGVNYLVHELQRRNPANLRANIYDPGMMPGTGLARDLPKPMQWAWNNLLPKLTRFIPGAETTQQSALHLVDLALGVVHTNARGCYIAVGKLAAASDESDDPAREAELWSFCDARIPSSSNEVF